MRHGALTCPACVRCYCTSSFLIAFEKMCPLLHPWFILAAWTCRCRQPHYRTSTFISLHVCIREFCVLGEAGPVVPCVCMACLCHARPRLSAPVHVIQNQRLKVSLLEQSRSCHEHRFNVFTHKNSPKVGHAACPLRTPPCPLLSGVALTRFQMCLRHSALHQVSLESAASFRA